MCRPAALAPVSKAARVEPLEGRRHLSVVPITGVDIGSPGSYRNQGNTFAKAEDGDLGSYFDAPAAAGQWVGLAAPVPTPVAQIAYAPRPGWAGRMLGGVFQASTSADFSSGTVDLYTVTTAPASGRLTTVPVTPAGTYRYFRYLSPANGYGNVAEVQFAAVSGNSPTPSPTPTPAPTVLVGTTIGSPGSYRGQGNTVTKATDGDLSSFFDGTVPNGQWVGLDLGEGATASVTQLSYAPRPGMAGRMVGGLFQASDSATFSTGDVTLFTVTVAPGYNRMTTVAVNVAGTYRYVRYLGPNGGYGNVAEVQFAGTAVHGPTPTPAPTITGWSTVAPSPVERAEAVGTVLDGVVYVFGGLTNQGSAATTIPLLSRCDAYTVATNTWRRLADFPEPFSHAEAVVVGTDLWFVGGFVGDSPGPETNHVWVYHTPTDTWTRGPDLPAASGAGAAALVGRTIYFAGGADRTPPTDLSATFALDVDDPSAGWVRKADLPNGRNHVAAAAVGGYLYVMGGQHGLVEGQVAQSEVDRYDPTTDTWAVVAPLPAAAGKSHIMSGTFAYDGRIIVVGGEVGYDVPQRAVMSYDPVADQWTQIGLLPAARSTVVAGIADGKLVVTTGNGPSATDTTWIGTFSP